MLVILIDLALAYAIGKFAESKGRNFWGWGVASLFFSPILVGIVLALVKNLKQEQEFAKRSMEQEQLHDRVAVNEVQVNQRFENVEQQLSHMKERVDKLEGKHEETLAGSASAQLEAGAAAVDATAADAAAPICPHCHSAVKPNARFCSNCGAPLKKEG